MLEDFNILLDFVVFDSSFYLYLKLEDGLKDWLSVREVAKHLKVSKETVYKWLAAQSIPAHRVGKLWRFDAEEIDRWVLSAQSDDLEIIEPTSKNSAGGVSAPS